MLSQTPSSNKPITLNLNLWTNLFRQKDNFFWNNRPDKLRYHIKPSYTIIKQNQKSSRRTAPIERTCK